MFEYRVERLVGDHSEGRDCCKHLQCEAFVRGWLQSLVYSLVQCAPAQLLHMAIFQIVSTVLTNWAAAGGRSAST